MRGRLRGWAIGLLLFLSNGVAQGGVEVVGGTGRWAGILRENWQPQCEDALKAYRASWTTMLGQRPVSPPEVILAADVASANAASSASPDALILTVSSASHRRSMQERMTLALLEELNRRQIENLAGSGKQHAPAWLTAGLARSLAYEQNRTLPSGFGPDQLSERTATALRNAKDPQEPLALLQAGASVDAQKAAGDVSVVLVGVLRSSSGPDFEVRWIDYYRRLARGGPVPGSASELLAGLDEGALRAQAEARIRELRAEVRGHADPVPEASGYAAIDALDRLLSDGEAALRGYRSYLAARPPKAIAMSRRGAFAFVQDHAQAMSRALEHCRDLEPVGCELYAVDDRVVYRPREWQASDIELRMIRGDDGDWRRVVARAWLPVVERSAQAFNAHIRQELDSGLEQPVQVFLTATRDDFEEVLAGPMRLTREGAGEHASALGVSNERGQVVIRILDTYAEASKTRIAVKTTLHELTHEFQAQLARGYRGFRPAPWMLEGSADLLAYTIAGRLDMPEAREFSLAMWRDACVKRYKAPMSFTVSVEELMTAKSADWRAMSRFNKGNYQVAGLMVEFLRERLGARFGSAWLTYFRLAGQKGQDEAQAFAQSFGMTRETYVAELKLWLASL